MSTFEKVCVIDGKGHLMGRLASTVAKMLLQGQRVVVVRCEEINISGPLFRNKIKMQSFLQKRCLVNPKKGPLHHRAPSRVFYRSVRGMMPHRTKRGMQALQRFKVLEGIPPKYNVMKRMVVPQALRVLRLKPGSKYTTLSQLCSEIGWNYKEVIETLEAKRKVHNEAYVEKAKAKQVFRAKCIEASSDKIQKAEEALAGLGY
ncbi:60S ribosomal protein L16A [Dimargaris verticillata]|uniref:60S ribosomal protein L16A n=1 Tax=Dimargaris verticillata TaxID=2761393 RepID=A0A9W8B7C0_9FUNG|nr:60S ribosomal protein L16A [Dimargaris verticillata]